MGLWTACNDVAGRFLSEKVRSPAKAVVALRPINPAQIKPWKNQAGEQVGITESGKPDRNIAFEDLLIDQPAVPWMGQWPLQVALGSVDADTAQTDFIRAFFDNGGQPGGILKKKGVLTSQNEANMIQQRWAAKYGRGGDSQFAPAVLDDNMEYQKIGSMLDELDSESIRSFSESRICMAFGVPPLIVYAYSGLLRATYSNLGQAWASFWDAELSPMLKARASFLDQNLLVDFEGEEKVLSEQVRCAWDLSKVAALQEDVDAAQTRARANFAAGLWTLNESRAATNAPADPGGDYYLRPMTSQPVEVGSTVLDMTPAPIDAEKQRVAPSAFKALKRASTQSIEQRMQKQVQAYLAEEYETAARAIAGG